MTDTVTARRRIFLMRHGSVSYFDETGRAQASAAGRVFAAEGMHFDRVIVSGLPRTVETATRVLAETRQQVQLETWPELAEIRGGKLSGIPDEQLREAFTGAFDGVVPEQRRFLGGESVAELMDRVHPALARLLADPGWDTVLLVLHGGVNRAILSYALTGGQRLFLGNLSQAAGCINALDVGQAPHDWLVRFSNFSPPSPLQTATRTTTMEQLLEQYKKSRLLSHQIK